MDAQRIRGYRYLLDLAVRELIILQRYYAPLKRGKSGFVPPFYVLFDAKDMELRKAKGA